MANSDFQPVQLTQQTDLGGKVTDDLRSQLLSLSREQAAIGAGRGSSNYINQTIMTQFDRFGNTSFQTNSEMVGLTFFTKPRLNLGPMSVRQDPTLAMLDTLDPDSWMFAVRCNLDTVFAKSSLARGVAEFCPWFNDTSPFNVPMSNFCLGVSGWPDYSVEYETTESGTFSEDMTMVRGSDWGRRTYDLSFTFRDVQGGFLLPLFYYWLLSMALQMEGATVAYPEDRDANRLNYTVSIFRLTLDPYMRRIVSWSRAAGCFPVSVPIGDKFNFGPGDSHIHTSQQFTIPFKANIIKYMDPRDLADFNTLVARYGWQSETERLQRVRASVTPEHNFSGLPWIDLVGGQNELSFLALPEELQDPTKAAIEKIKESILAQTKVTASATTPTTTTSASIKT